MKIYDSLFWRNIVLLLIHTLPLRIKRADLGNNKITKESISLATIGVNFLGSGYGGMGGWKVKHQTN